MQKFSDIYPFNLARDIFGSAEEAEKIYLPGIFDALAMLTEREQDILRQRYGEKMTLRAIGQIHGVGQERIRQIIARALRRLRHPSRVNMFKAVPLAAMVEQNIKYQKICREYEFLSKAFEAYTAMPAAPDVVVPMAELAVTMQTPISELDFTVRTHNCLKRAGKNTLRDIVEMTEDELMSIRNLGRKSAIEVIHKVRSYGLDIRRQYT